MRSSTTGARSAPSGAHVAARGIAPLDVEVFFLSPDVDMVRFARAAEVAAEVGAATLLAVVADPDRQRAIERFDALCDAAASCALDVALEFRRWSPVATIDAAAAFLAEADRPNAGICVDALHLGRSGGDPTAIPALPRAGSFPQLCDAKAKHRRHAERSVTDRALLAGEALRVFLVRRDGMRAAEGHLDGATPRPPDRRTAS